MMKCLAIVFLLSLSSVVGNTGRKAEVWFDRSGNPVRLSEVNASGDRHPTVVELDETNRQEWADYLAALEVEVDPFGISAIDVYEPIGATHQLMRWRGFSRRAYPSGWSVRRYGWRSPRYYFGWGGGGRYWRSPGCGRSWGGTVIRFTSW